jgi:hypothetical protein
VSRDERIHGYFSKLKGTRDQKRLGNTSVVNESLHVLVVSGVSSVVNTDKTWDGCVTNEFKFSQLLIIKNGQS